MNKKATLANRLDLALQVGKRGTFGIALADDDNSLCLYTERRMFPIIRLRLEVVVANEIFKWSENDWTGEAMISRNKDGPCFAQFSFRGDGVNLDTEQDKFHGRLTLIAAPRPESKNAFALDAVFALDADDPISSVVWDSSDELVTHWIVATSI